MVKIQRSAADITLHTPKARDPLTRKAELADPADVPLHITTSCIMTHDRGHCARSTAGPRTSFLRHAASLTFVARHPRVTSSSAQGMTFISVTVPCLPHATRPTHTHPWPTLPVTHGPVLHPRSHPGIYILVDGFLTRHQATHALRLASNNYNFPHVLTSLLHVAREFRASSQCY